jgi:hypothetical protein
LDPQLVCQKSTDPPCRSSAELPSPGGTHSLKLLLAKCPKLHAGDALVGTSLFSVYGGVADAEMMDAVCFNAFALGNHEFDDGDAALAEFITILRNSTTCLTSVLAANLVSRSDSPLLALQQSGAIIRTLSIAATSRWE